jgi:Uma2 family endonuclease
MSLYDDSYRTPYRFTAAQVLQMSDAGILGEDVELWDGTLYKMTKGELHNCIVGLIADALRPAGGGAGYHIREEKSAWLDEYSLPKLDVAVCRGERTDYSPDLPTVDRFAIVIEVRSTPGFRPGVTPRVDRNYADAGVPVYWIVDARNRTVEVCSQPTSTYGYGYDRRETLRVGESISVVIDGQERGRILVASIFPEKK